MTHHSTHADPEALRAAEQARRFIGNSERIQAACEAPGPFVYAVHERRIERL